MNAVAIRPKLARVLGMLGSDHDGEVLAAARQAERLRREMGVSWSDLIEAREPQPRPSPAPRPTPEPDIPHWRMTVARCRAHPDRLSNFERTFLASLSRFRRISPRQAAVLASIAERLAMEDAA